MFFCLPFHRRCCVFCTVTVWAALGVSTVIAENQDRLFQRAEGYLNSRETTVESYALVVRGLLHAGYSPQHPFLRAKIDVLLRLTPRNATEATRQREIVLLIQLNNPAPSAKDATTLWAAVASDFCNDHYRRFGIVRLPQGFKPKRSPDVPLPERESDTLLVAVSALLSLSRHVEHGDVPTVNIDVVSSSCSHPADIDRPVGYILVAKTVRLRN